MGFPELLMFVLNWTKMPLFTNSPGLGAITQMLIFLFS